MWELDNEIVDVISDDMAEVLWRCGLRFVDEEKEEPLLKKAKNRRRKKKSRHSG